MNTVGTLQTGLRAQQLYSDTTRLLFSGLERQFQNGNFSDIVVLTPAGKRLKCHQLVLSACSKKFAGALENGDFAGQELPVQGVDSEALESVIRFFYTAEILITMNTVVPLLDAAIKLDVGGLIVACEQFIQSLLYPATAIQFLQQSVHLKIEMLTEALSAFIGSRFDEVISSPNFTSCDYNLFLKIVLDNKQRQSDTTLFKAASKWIFAESSRMEMADEVFRLLDISQELVQVLAQQQTALQFVQQQQPQGILIPSDRLGHNSEPGGMLGGGGLQSVTPLQGLNSNTVQLLPGGGTMALPASLALQLQQGRTSIGGHMGLPGQGGQDGGASNLVNLVNSQIATQLGGGASVQGLRGVLAAAGGTQGMGAGLPHHAVGGSGGSGLGQDMYGAGDVTTPTLGMRRPPGLADGNGRADGRGRGGSGDVDRGGSGRGASKRGRREAAKSSNSGGEDDLPRSPSAAIAEAKRAMAEGRMTFADFGLDVEALERLPTIGNTPPTLRGVCHVDNCNMDLTQLRDYHQRFKICDNHLKANAILKDGVPQRFCQQCGRFHLLTEFDGNKRSCRARLQRHNARRRKRMENEGNGGDGDGFDGMRDSQERGDGHMGMAANAGLASLSAAAGAAFGGRTHNSYAGNSHLTAQLGQGIEATSSGHTGRGNWPGGLAGLNVDRDVAAALRASGILGSGGSGGGMTAAEIVSSLGGLSAEARRAFGAAGAPVAGFPTQVEEEDTKDFGDMLEQQRAAGQQQQQQQQQQGAQQGLTGDLQGLTALLQGQLGQDEAAAKGQQRFAEHQQQEQAESLERFSRQPQEGAGDRGEAVGDGDAAAAEAAAAAVAAAAAAAVEAVVQMHATSQDDEDEGDEDGVVQG